MRQNSQWNVVFSILLLAHWRGKVTSVLLRKWQQQPKATFLWSFSGPLEKSQTSCLENPIDRGAWWAAVHGVAKSWTWLSDFTFTFHFHVLEKEMATHSSVFAWRIPGTGEHGGLPSMGSHRVGHDWSALAAAAAAKSCEKFWDKNASTFDA